MFSMVNAEEDCTKRHVRMQGGDDTGSKENLIRLYPFMTENARKERQMKELVASDVEAYAERIRCRNPMPVVGSERKLIVP